MVEADISAGSQDEEMTRHHSSSPQSPHPRPNDTSPIKTAQTPSPTDLADPLAQISLSGSIDDVPECVEKALLDSIMLT